MISPTYEIWVERHTICLALRKVSQEHATSMRVSALAAVVSLGSSILMGLPVLAQADSDPRTTPPPRPDPAKRHHVTEILLDMNHALGVERTESGSFQIRKSYGFEYAHRFDFQGGGPPLILSILGPAIPGRGRRLGISIELKF